MNIIIIDLKLKYILLNEIIVYKNKDIFNILNIIIIKFEDIFTNIENIINLSENQ